MPFSVRIAQVTGSGLERTVKVDITNEDRKEARNAWGEVEVFSSGVRIRIDGKDRLRQTIGTIDGKKTVSQEATLRFGLLDGLRLRQDGAKIKLTIGADGLEPQSFELDYRP